MSLFSTTTLRVLLLLCALGALSDTGSAQQQPILYGTGLLEAECEDVGQSLRTVRDEGASRGRAVGASASATATTPPEDVAANRIRVHPGDLPLTADYVLNFRLRNPTIATPVAIESALWVRANDGDWELYTVGIGTQWRWVWSERGFNGIDIIALNAGDGNYIDIAFTRPGDELDQVYYELRAGAEVPRARPFGGTTGNNCADFTNLPPVASQEDPGDEVFVPERINVFTGPSFDPDGEIIQYDFSPDPEQQEPLETFARIELLREGDIPVTVTVTDYYGASDTDTVLYRGVPRIPVSDRTAYRLLEDCAENQLNYVVDVPAEEAGNYYLAGRFETEADSIPTLMTRINGGEWNEWTIIDPELSFFPVFDFELTGGRNTIEFAYTSAEVAIEELILSPDTESLEQGGNPANLVNMECTTGTTSAGDLQAGWLDAECANYGTNWRAIGDLAAANGAYVVVQGLNSLPTPPADEPANLIRFPLTDVDLRAGEPLYLYGRIDAPTGDDDSFWVRLNGGPWVAWKMGIRQGRGFVWNRFPGSLTAQAGQNLLEVAYREDGTKLDRIYFSNQDELGANPPARGSNCPAAGMEDVAREGECGIRSPGWVPNTSSSASNQKSVFFFGRPNFTRPTGEGEQTLTYTVDLAIDATYYLFGRINAPDPGRNSVWVRVDEGPWLKWWQEIGGAQLLTRGFAWRKVSDDGTAVSFDLTAGTHTIRIAHREPGTRIDKLQLSLNDVLPSGFGAAAPACERAPRPASAMAPASSELNLDDLISSALEVYPNPTVDRLQMEWASDYVGQLEVLVHDTNGRRVLATSHTKAQDFFRTQVDVRTLPTGLYRLQLIAGDRRVVQTFVKY